MEKKYSCTVEGCNTRFENVYKQQYHVATVHDKVKPFECATCTAVFSKKAGLLGHFKIPNYHDHQPKLTGGKILAIFDAEQYPVLMKNKAEETETE